jgi:DNA repair protein RecO (recombination protein O)
LDVFSSQYGRVNLVAKGVRGKRLNQSILLQPARKLAISFGMRSELGTLFSVEDTGARYQLAGTRIISCFYMNELLVRMLHKHESHPELFKIYDTSLLQLHEGDDEDRILRIFEKHLLNTLGYGLILDHEVTSGSIIERERKYYYQIDRGPLMDQPKTKNSITVSGYTLLALEQENKWDKKIASESKSLLRSILATHTGDRPLGSRELYKAYLNNLMSAH